MLRGARTVLVIFLFLFCGALLFLNWRLLEDIFNYKTIYGNVFQTFKETYFHKEVRAVRVPEINLVPSAEAETESNQNFPIEQVTQPDAILIPKIGITAPLFMAENAREDYMQALLKKGVVAFPGSILSKENGIAIILGHSAPPGWPKKNYDWVFSNLNDLEAGDEIIVTYQQQTLRYTVTKKFFLKKGEEIPITNVNGPASTIILITCWPPGIDSKRIAVQAELI